MGAYWKVLGFIQTYFANLITSIKQKFIFFLKLIKKRKLQNYSILLFIATFDSVTEFARKFIHNLNKQKITASVESLL